MIDSNRARRIVVLANHETSASAWLRLDERGYWGGQSNNHALESCFAGTSHEARSK